MSGEEKQHKMPRRATAPFGRAVARYLYPQNHRRSGESGDDRLVRHRWNISCKVTTRATTQKELRLEGQAGDQDAFDVTLVPADGIRVDMHGCQDINSECTNIYKNASQPAVSYNNMYTCYICILTQFTVLTFYVRLNLRSSLDFINRTRFLIHRNHSKHH
jgi:hypothetical protein